LLVQSPPVAVHRALAAVSRTAVTAAGAAAVAAVAWAVVWAAAWPVVAVAEVPEQIAVAQSTDA
jgi:hypothetical protein